MKYAELTYKKIFIFWIPLAATWLMMATEGPFLAAVIARLAEPKYNLAAYGVAFAFAVLIEAPIIMIMSASTALVKDKDSYKKLRNFTYTLNAIITFTMVIFLIPPIFFFIAQNLIGLPSNVAKIAHHASIIMLPWPSAIGFRRFFQGILIRSDLTRRVAYGTMVRLLTMAAVSLFLYWVFKGDGALVGAIALSAAVTMESIATRLMAQKAVKDLLQTHNPSSEEIPLSYQYITKFYYPLALTSVLALGVLPMVTFFLGHSRMSLESLAVFPVISSLVFIFRSFGLSYQEVGIALLGEHNEGFARLRNFAIMLGIIATLALILIAFTPLSGIWFQKVSGLSSDLSQFAVTPTRILALIPALTVFIAFGRAIMVAHKKTTPVTIATAVEVTVIFSVLFFTIHVLDLIGAVGAAIGILTGRFLADVYLFFPCYQAIKFGRHPT